MGPEPQQAYSDQPGELAEPLDQTLLAVLTRVSFGGSLHETCAEPAHLLFATEMSDDEVVYKLLDHVTDVDKWIDKK